jgi:hypothetical protein
MRVLSRLLLLGFALTVTGGAALAQPAPADPVPTATDDGGDDSGEATSEGADEDTGGGSPFSKGTLIIKVTSRTGAAIEDATVTIDDRSMGELEDGELTLTNIPQGSHAVAIEAAGYRRFERAVTIQDGEHARIDAMLVERPPPPPPRYSSAWKWSLGASVLVAATGLSYAVHSTGRMTRNFEAVDSITAQNPDGSGPWDFSFPLQYADCGKAFATIEREKYLTVLNGDRFERTCTWRDRMQLGYITAAVGGAGIFVSALMLIRHRVVRGPLPVLPGPMPIAIVPTVTPGGGGASLTLTW